MNFTICAPIRRLAGLFFRYPSKEPASGTINPRSMTEQIFRAALLVSPCDGIHLEDKRQITSQLLQAGADITELNTVRKHLSMVKGSNHLAIEAARTAAESLGLETRIIADNLAGEAREAGRWLGCKALVAKLQKEGKPLCLLSGGETTVTVTGNGRGGRSMELALAFAREIDGTPGITLLSASTDGSDGPTDAAGAVVDGMTLIRAGELGLDAETFLRDNDSYNFFRESGGLFVTGPTGTNVMDIQIVVIE